jgi:hypothetical protein
MSQQSLKDLILSKLATRASAGQPPQAKRDYTIAPSPWKCEAIVYLATTTHCACGEVVTQTNPHPLLKRVSAKGIHEEAIKLSPHDPRHAFLPVCLEERHIEISNCHSCIEADIPNPYQQLDMFQGAK